MTASDRRRQGVLAVHSIDHFALDVPDLDEAESFCEAFGLDVRKTGDTLEILAVGAPHRWAVLRRADGPKRLAYLSFGVFEDEYDAFARHLQSAGVTIIPAPAGCEDNGLWIAGFDGLPLNIRVAEKSAPDGKTRFEVSSSRSGESGAIFNSRAPKVHPRAMSHFALFTTDVIAATSWYENVLGLRLSDGSGPVVAFLHGAHGSDHHLLALVGSSHRGMHHASWDVASFQEVGLGSAQMMRAGYKQGWGVGRHVLGGNYFYYARDPWGSFWEYSADIDYIPHDVEWPAAQHPPEDSFYLWGPDVPPEMVMNCEPGGPNGDMTA